MTGADMMLSLGYRMEDLNEVNFAEVQKLVALNDAQRQVVSMCTNEALVHLQALRDMGSPISDTNLQNLIYFNLPTSSAVLTDVTATAPGSGESVFSKAAHGLVDGDFVTLRDFTQMTDINGMTAKVDQTNSTDFKLEGVLGTPAETSAGDDLGGTVEKLETSIVRVVQVYDNTNDRNIEIVTPDAFRVIGGTTGLGYSYGTKGVFMNNRFYVSASDATTILCSLIYVASPPDIADAGTEITYLSDSVQQAIVEMAESLLWRQDNKLNRAAAAKQSATEIVTSINSMGV